MNSVSTKIVAFVLSVFILIMVISQIVIKLNVEYTTEIALPYNTTESLIFKGVYIRDEEILNSKSGGVISYTLADGSKVAKNSVIAKSYKTQEDLAKQRQIDEIRQRISVLQDAQKLAGIDNSQLEVFNTQIYEKHRQLSQALKNKTYSTATELQDELYTLLCKQSIVKGDVGGYSEKISQLEGQISALEKEIKSVPTSLVAEKTGYFVSTVDGYENQLNYETAENITKEQFDEIVENPDISTGKSLGKIVDNYKWKLAAVLKNQDAFGIFESSVVKITVGAEAAIIHGRVSKIIPVDDDTSIFIFDCDYLRQEFLSGRTAQFKLVLDDYRGVRISRNALRFDKDNNQGVYVEKGNQAHFKKIDVLYWQEDYIIAAISDGEGYLALYDTIIIEGKDLYDGKVIQ